MDELPARTRALIAFVAAVVLTALRRPDQFLRPAVWVEDGRYLVPEFLQQGYRALFLPVSGYYVTPSRLINVLGLTLSGRYYPEIASTLNVLVCAASVAVIAIAPTVLRARLLCVAVLLLIPTAPEVFGVSLYAFWWTSLLVVLAVLWEDAARSPLARCALIVIGGLSSPAVIGFLPLFALRWLKDRTRHELAALATATVCAAIQVSALVKEPGATAHQLPSLLLALRRFVGEFFILRGRNHEIGAIICGAVFTVAILAYAFVRWRRGDWGWAYLAGAWLLCLVMACSRGPIDMVHPVQAGPRYFFFPYALMGWMLVRVLVESRSAWVTVLVVTALLVGVRQSKVSFMARHEALDWRGSLEACARGEPTNIPVHYDGVLASAWLVPLTAGDCQRLLQ